MKNQYPYSICIMHVAIFEQKVDFESTLYFQYEELLGFLNHPTKTFQSIHRSYQKYQFYQIMTISKTKIVWKSCYNPGRASALAGISLSVVWSSRLATNLVLPNGFKSVLISYLLLVN